jgi:phage baseplate assembly protein V
MSPVQRLLAPLRRRVQGLVTRCVVSLVNDSLTLQGVQITLLAGQTQEGVERMQQYGFTSVPEPGAEGLALAVGGEGGHRVVIALEDRRYRKTGLAAGEVAQYSRYGNAVHLKADGSVVVTGTSILIGAGAGEAIPLGDAVLAWLNGHTHLGNLGYQTSAPTVPGVAAELLSQQHKVE